MKPQSEPNVIAISRLREYMRETSTTQHELAARVGVSQPFISQILRLQRSPRLRTMRSIKEATTGYVDLHHWDTPRNHA